MVKFLPLDQAVAENLHDGVVKFAEALDETPAPSELELKTLRDLQARTKAAHKGTGKEKAA